jgi:hypothetical protein
VVYFSEGELKLNPIAEGSVRCPRILSLLSSKTLWSYPGCICGKNGSPSFLQMGPWPLRSCSGPSSNVSSRLNILRLVPKLSFAAVLIKNISHIYIRIVL